MSETTGKSIKRSLLATAGGLSLVWSSGVIADDQIFETNVTNDLNLMSGEPQIAVDPTNPQNLAIVEFAVGSSDLPAYSFNFNDYRQWAHNLPGGLRNSGRVVISNDGGNSWTVRPTPVYYDHKMGRYGGGDPYIAYGARGELYAGNEIGRPPETHTVAQNAMATSDIAIAVSTDGGQTFSPQQSAGTPINRPWLTVDLSTGTLYSVSSGPLDVSTGQHNIAGPDAPNDRWLVAWQPELAGKSEPRRLGGPDFSAAAGSTFSAANGVVAATFVLGGPAPGQGIAGAPKGPQPVPDSLLEIMKDGVTTCSMQDPCLFFETSSDEGRSWARRHLPVPGGFATGGRASVAADPGRAGRFAVAVLDRERTGILVFVTDDYGETWSGPATVPETAKGPDFKLWMAYGPTGVLGLVWKDEVEGPAPQEGEESQDAGEEHGAVEVGFDVYSAISCDGGTTWFMPVRVNAESSPPGDSGSDDLSYIALDDRYAHMVWGDRRHQAEVQNVPGAGGGRQAYYGRVPFSAASKGAACGGQ